MEEAWNAALLFIQHPGSGKRCEDVLGGVKGLWSQSTLECQTLLSSASYSRKRLQDVCLVLHCGGAGKTHGEGVMGTDR